MKLRLVYIKPTYTKLFSYTRDYHSNGKYNLFTEKNFSYLSTNRIIAPYFVTNKVGLCKKTFLF